MSIVVPTRARPAQLSTCLQGIVDLDIDPKLFEVVVIDDGGPGSLKPVLEPYFERMALRLVVKSRSGGPAAARNAGADAARGRFLAFIDDDCIPSRDWLSAFVQELDLRPDCLFGGYVRNGLSANPYSAASEQIATYVRQYYQRDKGIEWFFTGNNLALSAERFRELGGFDTSIPSWTAEDKEFCDRWRARKYAMAYAPNAVVHHRHDLSGWRFARQHFNYGRGILVFRLMRRHRGRSPIRPEPLAFYRNLILYPMRDQSVASSWRQVILIIVAQAATLAGALWASLLERPKSLTERVAGTQDASAIGPR